jgi:hypothetical protein
MNAAVRILSALAGLAIVSASLAVMLLPALAIANGTADFSTWPSASRQAFPIMAGACFVCLGILELLSKLLESPPAFRCRRCSSAVVNGRCRCRCGPSPWEPAR